MLDAARDALMAHMGLVGNPSALHAAGRAARSVVDEARETVADALDAHPSEVLWTSGGTEADNLAIKGLYWARQRADARRTRIVVSAVEHHAVLEPAEWLAHEHGAHLVLIPVDGNGVIDLAALEREIAAHASHIALISVMWANNEVGSIQPVAQVASLAAPHGIPVHSDAVQAVGHVPVSFQESGLTALSFSAHKVGGPVGVGGLVVTRTERLEPVTHGGGQERQIRSGTLDAAGFAAAAAALRWAVDAVPEESARLRELQAQLVERIGAAVPDAHVSGAPLGEGRLPGNVHVCFPGADPDALMFMLDSHGIQASTGAACSAGVHQASHVLLAMGRPAEDAASTMRFTLGHTTTQDDIDALVAVLPEAVERARRVHSA